MPWIPGSTSAVRRLFDYSFQVDPQVEKTLALIPPDGRIADLGAGGRKVRPDAVCIDAVPGPGTDIVADIHHLPLPDGEFSLVLCTGTLNLCTDPKQVLRESFRILEPGGYLHLEAGMFQPYNPEPEDYWRWTLPGLERMCADVGFAKVRSGAHMGPMTALSCAAIYIAGKTFEGPGLARKLGRAAAHGLFGPLKYADSLLPERALRDTPFAYGNYYVGRKPARL